MSIFLVLTHPPRQWHELLDITRQTHCVPVVAVTVDVRVEERIVEAHVARADEIVVRGGPVIAVVAHQTDRSPVAAARSRQEDRTSILKRYPLIG